MAGPGQHGGQAGVERKGERCGGEREGGNEKRKGCMIKEEEREKWEGGGESMVDCFHAIRSSISL